MSWVVPLTKLTTTDAFVVTDIPGAPATGVVRRARKILHSSAADLARSATYAFASFGLERSGASAGINAEGEAAGPAAEAFCAELLGRAPDIHLVPGKGMTSEELRPLHEAAGRHSGAGSKELTAAGVASAIRWACGGSVGDRSVVVEGTGVSPLADLVARALIDEGATIVEPGGLDTKPWLVFSADVDVIACGTKPGVLTHQAAPMITAGAVVPWGPIPVTTKAYVMLRRAGVEVLPDFVTAAGGLVTEYLPGSGSKDVAGLGAQVADEIASILDECAPHPEGVMMAAFERAERFLAGWTDAAIFGRPLAA